MKNKSVYRRVLQLVMLALVAIIIGLIVMTGTGKNTSPKVGLVITGKADDEGWNGMHYRGVSQACEKLGAELLVAEDTPEEYEGCADAIHKLAKEGATMIILSSYGYPMLVQDVIEGYPDIAFYGSSAEYVADNYTSYFGRMYQARYLAGIVAGMQTKSNSIGYVAAMSNTEVNRGINAFTLGVQSVNPDAVVNVIWTGAWDDEQTEKKSAETLIEQAGADVLTYHQNRHYVAQAADKAGVYSIGYNTVEKGLSDNYLTAAVWDWQALYFQIVREFVQGKANTVKQHWFGMDTGVVKLSECSKSVTEETRRHVESVKQEILGGKNIFSGKIYDNSGELRCDEGEIISDGLLLEKMDWFVEGVRLYEVETGY